MRFLSAIALTCCAVTREFGAVTCFTVGTSRVGFWGRQDHLPSRNHHRQRSLGTSKTVLSSTAPWLDSSVPLNVAREVHKSVVLVLPTGVRDMKARGSGFVLRNFNATTTDDDTNPYYTYVVTAAHVTPPGFAIEVTLNEEIYPATVIERNKTLDLALLRVPYVDDVSGLHLASETPEVGTIAFSHGYPASRLRGPAMTSGIVCGIADGLGFPEESNMTLMTAEGDPAPKDTVFVVTDAGMSGGMSGGPLTDDKGTVLGVNALVRPDLRALGNYAVSADVIRPFLKQIPLSDSSGYDESSVSKINGFKVMLFNDPMNKKERVAKILKEVAKLEEKDANRIMMDAHTTGQGEIGSYADFNEADKMRAELRKQDILVDVERY